MRTVVNFVAFQVGWFACVLGTAHGHPWLGSAAVLAVLALHLVLSPDPWAQVRLALVAVALGFVLETVLMASGVARYAEPGPFPLLPPGWILAMWVLLATLLESSLAWLQKRLWLAVLFAAVGAPMSYAAGARFGGMEIAEPLWRSFAVMGVLWAAAFPALLFLAARLSAGAAASSAGPVSAVPSAKEPADTATKQQG